MKSIESQKLSPNRLILYCLFIYLFLSPFYFFSSGLPQVADYFLCLAFFSLILAKKNGIALSVDQRLSICLVFAFSLWVFFVSFVNFITWQDPMIVLPAIFMFFNFGVFFFAFNAFYYNHHLVINRLYDVLAIIGGIIIFSVFADGAVGGARVSGFFNNPNQLAYFCVLLLAMLIGCVNTMQEPPAGFFVVVFLYATGIIASASLTAYVCGAVLIMTAIWAVVGISGAFKFSLFLMVSLLLATFAVTLSTPEVFEIVDARLAIMNQKLENAAVERGYDRLVSMPEMIIFGAGEGGLERFGIEKAHEIHSTFATVLFSYGIIGFGLFITFLIVVARNLSPLQLVLLLTPLAYSLTHHGFRFSTFWVFMAFMLFLTRSKKTMFYRSAQIQLGVRI